MQDSMMKRLRRSIPAALAGSFFALICLIIYSANMQQQQWFFYYVDKWGYSDKLGHFLLFGILALLTNWALGFRCVNQLGKFAQIGSITVLSFALGEEVSQYWMSSRSMDLYDALADVAGVFLATIVSVLVSGFRNRN